MNTLPVDTNLEIAAKAYADRIKTHLESATGSWQGIAKEFANAAKEFGSSSPEMKHLSKLTKQRKGTISKLITIHESDRLKENGEIFGKVQAWTTLYEVTRLTDAQFDKLLKNLSPGEVVTLAQITAVRNPKKRKTNSYRTVLSVQVDINAIKSGKFEEYEKLKAAVEELQRTVGYVKVSEEPVIEKDAERFQDETDREFHKLVKAKWREEKKRFLKRPNLDETTKKEVKEDIEALVSVGQYEPAFERIGSDEFDQASLWSEAQSNVAKRREEKYGDKTNDPFAFAKDTSSADDEMEALRNQIEKPRRPNFKDQDFI